MDPDSPQDVQLPANYNKVEAGSYPFEMSFGPRDEISAHLSENIHAVDAGCCPYEMNFSKQPPQQTNGAAHLDPENLIYEKSSNGKHANGSADYDDDEDEDDLGPETDVDAVDETIETVVPCEKLSRELFPDKHDSESDIFQSEKEKFEINSPASPDLGTESRQHELLPEADNVADSEDSEDEWNYYRVEPDKDKDSSVLVNEPSSESKEEKEVCSPKPLIEDDSESEQPLKEESNCNLKSETELRTPSPGLTDKECIAEVRNPDEDFTFRKQSEDEPELEDMEFHLNPDAKEFIPPSMFPQRLNVSDYPISGSPLKQIPTVMDDISIPSEREFDEEISHRPSDLEDEASPISKPLDPEYKLNLDDSEISSTKAEFGDEISFLTTSEFQRTGVSAMDCSFTGSDRENYDISKDPMAMSFTPGYFEAAFEKGVDLNAVHDLSDDDFSDNVNGVNDEEMKSPELESVEEKEEPISPGNDQLFPFVMKSETETLERKSQNPFEMEILRDSLKEENFEPANPSELGTEKVEVDNYLLNSNRVPFTQDVQEYKVSESENSQLVEDFSPEQRDASPVPQSSAFGSSFDPVSQFGFQQPLQPETTDVFQLLQPETTNVIQPLQPENKDLVQPLQPETTDLVQPLQPETTDLVIESNQENVETFKNKEKVLEINECFFENKENVFNGEELVDKQSPIPDFEPEVKTNDIEFDPEIQEKSQTLFELSLESDHLEGQDPDVAQFSDETDKSVPIETEKIEANEIFEQKTHYAPVLNLSESQEFTGLERQVNEAKELENIVEYAQVTETTVQKENIDVEQKDVVENVASDNDLAREEIQKVEEPKSEVPLVAAAVAGAAAVAVTTAAVKATKKPAATASKTSTAKTLPLSKPTKSTPTSPTKTSTAARATAAAAKKPSTTISRPKQLDTKPVTGIASKAPAFKANPAPKTTTTAAKMTPRLSTAAPKPKTLVSSPKQAPASGDKKPTTNGEVKSLASKSTASRLPARPTSAATTRTTLVKSSSTTRTSSSTTAAAPAKSKLVSTSTLTKTASKTAAATTNRPKTAPATTGSTLGSVKPRVPAPKSPMIDKQIKETANKQISSSRVSSVTATRTSRLSAAASTTSTTVKRTSALKTSTTTTSATSPTKKPAPISKNYKPATKSTTKTAVTTTKKPIQNGNCEVQNVETVTTTMTTSNMEEDVPQKDISPTESATDNQLIMTSE